MTRIDPKAVPAMFEETKLGAGNGDFLREHRLGCSACLLGLMAVKATSWATAKAAYDNFDDLAPCRQVPLLSQLAKMADMPVSYAQGLSDGWEEFYPTYCSEENEDYSLGYSDGRAACEACEAAGII